MKYIVTHGGQTSEIEAYDYNLCAGTATFYEGAGIIVRYRGRAIRSMDQVTDVKPAELTLAKEESSTKRRVTAVLVTIFALVVIFLIITHPINP